MPSRFMDGLKTPQRERKPRERGLTVVMPQVDIPENVLEKYSDYIDAVKLLDAACWAPEEVILADIERYKSHDIEVQIGGAPGEVARLDGELDSYLDDLEAAGIDWVEYETHVDDPSVEEASQVIGNLKDRGFTVVGEVGAKWYVNDDTRYSLDRIKIDETIDRFDRYLEAGCDKVYWEGLIVRNLIGRELDHREGQKALLEVVESVGQDNIIFELWSPKLKTLEYAKFWSWLVYQFGPDVNVGNVPSQRVPRLESIRRGTTFDMNHQYIRWLQEGKPTENWWRMEVPPYDVGLERDD